MFSDNLNEWFEGFPNLDRIELEESVFGDIVKSMEIGKEDNFENLHVGDLRVNGSELDFDRFKPVSASALVEGESGCAVKVEAEEPKPEGKLSSSIEESKPADFDGFKPSIGGSVPVGGESGCTVKVEEEESKTEDFDGFEPSIGGSEPVGGESGCTLKVEEEESKPEGNLGLPIEEVIKKVSLVDGLESGNGSGSSGSDSESSSSSSYSSSSSDSDSEEEEEEEEEENKENVAVEVKRVDGADELEEGEIIGMNEEVTADGTDDEEEEEEDDDDITGEILSALDMDLDEVDEDEDGIGVLKGPIRSKNEVEVLPQVPPLDVELQPHHQMQPVGVILSLLGTKVIVEGREQHNPLNEGSVLWITSDRSPLGFVDEIFGPVKNPYYVVRYNCESEVPAGIHEGISISFVREFADHVLNDKNIHKKGYDASGENDEELTDDAEFSDDEKEADYKRMQKMTKRGMNDQRVGNRKGNKKKNNNRNGAWKSDRNSAQQTTTKARQHPPNNQNQHNFSTVSQSSVSHNCEQNFAGGSGFVPPFSVMPQSSGIVGPSNGVWPNRMPGQHPQSAIFPNGILSQSYQQQPISLSNPGMPMPNIMPYQQQQQEFNPSLSALQNMIIPGGQSNLFGGPGSAPWLGMAAQNGFNQSALGMAMQSQQFQNALLQGLLTNGPAVYGNSNLQTNGAQGNFESSQNFNMSSSSGRGRKPYHRGRGRFNGGRGHQRS